MTDQTPFDRRINAFRPDLAERALEGRVTAGRYTEGTPARVTLPVADMRPKPDLASGIDTQLLFGEPVTVLDRADGWAWVKSDIDAYVGYVDAAALMDSSSEPTHIVTAPRSFVYPEAELKRPVVTALSMGSRVRVTGEAEKRGTRYLLLADGGAMIAHHLAPLGGPIVDDYVACAARFMETPYLWGGRSGFGIDCSGLVQLSMLMAGMAAPRDSDMQESGLGEPIERASARRGDLVFWKGHVAIVEDGETVIHANGHTMTVARESIGNAIARIRPIYGEPTVWLRPL